MCLFIELLALLFLFVFRSALAFVMLKSLVPTLCWNLNFRLDDSGTFAKSQPDYMCCTSRKNISLYERDATLLNLVKLWLGLFFKELRCQKSISELRNGEGCRHPVKQFCMSCLWSWKHDSLPQVMVCVNLSPSLKLVLLQCYYSDRKTWGISSAMFCVSKVDLAR